SGITFTIYLGASYNGASISTSPDDCLVFSYTDNENPDDVLTVSTGSISGSINNVVVDSDKTEPMDFSGANGLYFWELFYYTPMLVVDRLLQCGSYDDAEYWLNFIFNPAGYVEGQGDDRTHTDRQWNCRPLYEDTAWDQTQLDSTDPDAVAQADPMHYKLATFMVLLDLLILRGDNAYRRLERDTLAEAKMWYTQALELLGDEPDISLSIEWDNPRLIDAESQTNTDVLSFLEAKNAAGRTANSLTGLFLPTENEKLKGYWELLNQRLYNLRNNLSIDGHKLNLPLYAEPADPKALQSAATSGNTGASTPPGGLITVQRFPVILNSAQALVNQLIQYGNTLAATIERKDAEALNMLMQNQADELMALGITVQDKNIEQLKAEQEVVNASLVGAQSRLEAYQALIDEGISQAEQKAMDKLVASGADAIAANAIRMTGAGLDLAPNIFGTSVGGSKWGAAATATAIGMDIASQSNSTTANSLSQSEQYRRRAQEWTI
ncbi:hypothetical protein ACQ96U_27050, partial [Zooshikella sp. RANM57]